MSISIFPDDLLIEVLAKLPPNCLLRFKCVSKSWRALIDSPEFVHTQLNRARTDPKAHAYIFRAAVGCVMKIYATKFDSPFIRKFTDLGKVNGFANDRILGDLRRTLIVGSCNGLLCLDKWQDKLVILWNPWIGKMFEIPYPRVQGNRTLKRRFCFGFGHDDASDDYKVVRLADHQETDESPQWCEVKVYSLKLNYWRRLKDFPYQLNDDIFGTEWAGVLSNCSLHWIMEGGGIAAIDLRTEDYRLIPIPESLKDYYSLNLGVLDGCLCLLAEFNRRIAESQVQLWVMKDYGIKHSWTKLSIEVSNAYCGIKYVTPVGYAEGTKQLLLLEGDEFQCYDTESKRLINTANFTETGLGDVILEGYYCVGSLVQPNNGGK